MDEERERKKEEEKVFLSEKSINERYNKTKRNKQLQKGRKRSERQRRMIPIKQKQGKEN